MAQSGPKPAAPPAAVGSGVAQQPKPIQVYEDIWVLDPVHNPIPGQWNPAKPVVLTREEVSKLKALSCVTDIAARRFDGVVDLRGPNGKAVPTYLWTFDSAFGISARGWAVPAATVSPDMLFVGSEIAKQSGLGASASPNDKLELIASVGDVTTYKDGQQVGGPVRKEILVLEPDGQTRVRRLAVKHGGALTQQPVLKGIGPADLVVRMAPLFLPAESTWTSIQRLTQGVGIVIYVRAKAGLNAAARAACQKQIEERTRAWNKQLPELSWTIEPLKIYF